MINNLTAFTIILSVIAEILLVLEVVTTAEVEDLVIPSVASLILPLALIIFLSGCVSHEYHVASIKIDDKIIETNFLLDNQK